MQMYINAQDNCAPTIARRQLREPTIARGTIAHRQLIANIQPIFKKYDNNA